MGVTSPYGDRVVAGSRARAAGRVSSGLPRWLAVSFLLLGATMSGDADTAGRPVPTPLPPAGWRLVTDGVMGGVSTGQLARTPHAGRTCMRLQGEVRTENNGGFIQMALELDDRLAALAATHDGILFEVLGNNEHYNVHLRTSDLWLPWQSYRAGFFASETWQTVRLPFSQFEPYRTGQALRVERLERIGIVAIGRPFEADVCVAGLALYREAD